MGDAEKPMPKTAAPNTKGTSFWNVNVPEEEQTEECPEWLSKVGERDRQILATKEEDFKFQTWPRVAEIISRASSP